MTAREFRRPQSAWTTCYQTGLRGWATKALAKQARRDTDAGMHVFRCGHCDRWHIGHGIGRTREDHRAYHAGEGEVLSTHVSVEEAVRSMKATKPGRMKALLIRAIEEGKADGYGALGIWFINRADLAALHRAAHDASQDLRLKEL